MRKRKTSRTVRKSDLSPRGKKIVDLILKTAREHDLNFGRGSFGVGRKSTDDGLGVFSKRWSSGPVCAVGAGILYRAVNTSPPPEGRDWTTSEFSAFAVHHGVPLAFAVGVSDGFEQESEPRPFRVYTSFSEEDSEATHGAPRGGRADYREGARVGRYIAQRAGLR